MNQLQNYSIIKSCHHSVDSAFLRRFTLFALFFLSAIFPFTGISQNDSETIASTEKKELAQASVEPARIRLFNWTLGVLRVTVFEHSPAVRAKVVQQRILELIDQGRVGKVESRLTADGTVITMDGELVMLIAPGDVDLIAGDTMEITVERIKHSLENALDKIRKQKDIKYNLKAAGHALIGMLIYLFLLYAMFRLQRWLRPKIEILEDKFGNKLQKIGVFSHSHCFYVFTVINKLALWTYAAVCTYLMLAFALKQFPYTQPWGDKLGTYIFNIISKLAENTIDAMPNLFVVFIIFVATHWIVKISKKFFKEVAQGNIVLNWLDPDAAPPTSKIFSAIIWIFGVVMAYPYIPGSNTEAFKGIGVFLGLLISLGASSMVGQVIGGMVLMYSRAMKVGEIVHIGEHYGKVMEIGFFSTKLRTMKNEEINIPNSVLMGSITKNYSRLSKSEGLIIHSTITIGYDAPWRQVHAMLINAAEKTSGIQKAPAPFVLQKALGDFYVEYEINAFLEKPESILKVKTKLHANIQDEFNKYGVQIMSPNFVAQPPEKVWVPKEKWYEAPAEKVNEHPISNQASSGTTPRHSTQFPTDEGQK